MKIFAILAVLVAITGIWYVTQKPKTPDVEEIISLLAQTRELAEAGKLDKPEIDRLYQTDLKQKSDDPVSLEGQSQNPKIGFVYIVKGSKTHFGFLLRDDVKISREEITKSFPGTEYVAAGGCGLLGINGVGKYSNGFVFNAENRLEEVSLVITP